MPVKLGPDGKVIEEETKKAASFEDEFRQESETGSGRPPTDQSSEAGQATEDQEPEQSGYEARTVLARSQGSGGQGQDVAADKAAPEDRTRIYRPGARKRQTPDQSPDDSAASPPADAMDDPPVGWLVVVQGPGQGQVVTLGNGVNTIGRAPSERVCLDFGDTLISRQRHALITYDPKGRKFYVQQGDGTNLTYIGDTPVLTPTELEEFSFIQMGETVLLFVPLGGERFDWAEYAE